jgi:hypothetical protein
VGRRDVDAEIGDQPGQPGHLALRQLHDQARERRRVDDGVLERTLQATADQPRVEGVVAVLDQHRAVGEAEERAAGVLEHRRTDEHRAVDVVAPARVGVDGRPAVDQRVEERESPLEGEAFGAQLEHQERGVAGRLDVEGDELCFIERREGTDLGSVDRDLLPRHEGGGTTRFEEQGPVAQRACTSARRAHAISSFVTARSRSTAIA